MTYEKEQGYGDFCRWLHLLCRVNVFETIFRLRNVHTQLQKHFMCLLLQQNNKKMFVESSQFVSGKTSRFTAVFFLYHLQSEN